MTLLFERLMPIHAALLDEDIQFFNCRYTWNDPTFGELAGSTVITGTDGQAALACFLSKHRHVTKAWIPEGKE
jgi:hypothetical protein